MALGNEFSILPKEQCWGFVIATTIPRRPAESPRGFGRGGSVWFWEPESGLWQAQVPSILCPKIHDVHHRFSFRVEPSSRRSRTKWAKGTPHPGAHLRSRTSKEPPAPFWEFGGSFFYNRKGDGDPNWTALSQIVGGRPLTTGQNIQA
jgi:hypothetical protein